MVCVQFKFAKVAGRSVFDMKKLYSAPSLELLSFCPDIAIGGAYTSDWTDEPGDQAVNSQPWNDGELGGWT